MSGDKKELHLFILRGLPGIGKSLLAKFLADSTEGIIFSADDYFINAVTEEYKFDKEKLPDAHKWNFERFKKALEEKKSPIIIDNSNIVSHHYWHYLDQGQRNNYLCSIITIPHNDVSIRELENRNVHDIKADTIRRMRDKFEWEIRE